MTERPSRDDYFLKMLALVAARSTCARRAVGAIIVDRGGHVLAMGYNGVPAGFPHCVDHPCPGAQDAKGDSSRCLSIHAEVNALLQCSRLDLAHTIYVSCLPCFSCAKALVNTPLKRVVAVEAYADTAGFDVLGAGGFTVEVAGALRAFNLGGRPNLGEP